MFEEGFHEAWRERYGSEPTFDFPEIERLLTHRSVRKYSDRPVTEATISALVAVAQSAATSSNLQLWSVISVQNEEQREKITLLCDDQRQIREAPWFLAFCADHHRLKHVAPDDGVACAGLDYTEFFTMAIIDASLAAERMVCAAEILGLSVCYIGALRNDPEGVANLLGFPDGVFGVFGLCIGYPADGVRAEIKPRLAQSNIWFRETYDQDVNVDEYNERMQKFYESQKMRGDVNWVARSGRRTDNHHLTGREVLLNWLRSKGFLRR